MTTLANGWAPSSRYKRRSAPLQTLPSNPPAILLRDSIQSTAAIAARFCIRCQDAFVGVRDAGTTAASVVQIAWNGLTVAGFKTIGASLLAVAASAVSNIAEIESRSEQDRTRQLRASQRAADYGQRIGGQGWELVPSRLRRTAMISEAHSTDSLPQPMVHRRESKTRGSSTRHQDSSPSAEIKPLPGRLSDYKGMADRANDAAQKARTEYRKRARSAADYGQALLKASEANKELAYRN